MCIRTQIVVGNIPGLLRIFFMQTENNMAITRNTTRPCFTPFCCEAHCQLHHLFTSCHFWFNTLWLICFRSFKYFYYENIIFDLRHFYFRHLFQEDNWDFKRFTATLEIPPHKVVNKQWRSFGFWLCACWIIVRATEPSKQQNCHSHEWATFLARNQSAVANHRVAVLIEHVMDAHSSVLYKQKNCSPVIRVTPMIYKQNQADSRMWDIGEGTRREMRNIHVIVLDNISACMSSKSLSNVYCKNGFTDITLRGNRGRLQSRVWNTHLAEVWYEGLLPRLLTRLEIQIHRHFR